MSSDTRTRGITLLVAACLFLVGFATPAEAEVVWWNEPPLPYDRPITFIDTVAPSVGPLRLVRWREIRNAALDSWGIPYAVGEDWTGNLPPCDGSGEQVGLTGLIRICRDPADMYSYGGWYATVQGGIAVIPLPRGWFKPEDPWNTTGILAHEVGHALGLGHSTTGVMGGAYRPNAEEIAAMQGYYA